MKHGEEVVADLDHTQCVEYIESKIIGKRCIVTRLENGDYEILYCDRETPAHMTDIVLLKKEFVKEIVDAVGFDLYKRKV
jgi:hypothetical protein